MAKCRLKIKLRKSTNEQKRRLVEKCDKCEYRFPCLTNRFGVGDIKLAGWAFYVPNDEEGREFIKQARKYINKDVFTVRPRGRAVNRCYKGGNRAYQPLETADSFAVYLEETSMARAVKRWWQDSRWYGAHPQDF